MKRNPRPLYYMHTFKCSDEDWMLKKRNVSLWLIIQLWIKSSSEDLVFFLFVHFRLYKLPLFFDPLKIRMRSRVNFHTKYIPARFIACPTNKIADSVADLLSHALIRFPRPAVYPHTFSWKIYELPEACCGVTWVRRIGYSLVSYV